MHSPRNDTARLAKLLPVYDDGVLGPSWADAPTAEPEVIPFGETTYRWAAKQGAETSDECYVSVLEDAVEVAMKASRSFADLVQESQLRGILAESVSSLDILTEFDHIWTEHEQFQVRVGVCGITGAGKTTLLNALLGFDEMLPSGCEGAATGTACFVHFNPSQESEKRFQAQVTFKSRECITHWLDGFFQEFRKVCHGQHQQGLRDGGSESEADDEDTDEEDDEDEEMKIAVLHAFRQSQDANTIEAADEAGDEEDDGEEEEDDLKIYGHLSGYLEPIYATWKYTVEQLKSLSTEQILQDNLDITRLLSSTDTLCYSELASFSDAIKSFLDSTEFQGLETVSGEGVQLWPLIERVDLYVPAPILQNGVVLIDVPGLSDAVEMRAEVSRHTFRTLDASIIVSPIFRIKDEKQTSQLVSEHQALHLELEGKFTARQFCYAASKTDENINCETYARRDGTLAKARKLKQKTEQGLAKARDETWMAEQDLARSLEDGQDHRKTKRAGNEAREANNHVLQARQKQAKLEERLAYYHGYITHLCMQTRNAYVSQELVKDYLRRKVRFKKGKKAAAMAAEDPIQVFPICSSAFSSLTRPDPSPVPGFPDVRYTGVPALTHWIRRASLPARKRHALTLLHRFSVVLNLLLTLSGDKQLQPSAVVNNRAMLQNICSRFKSALLKNQQSFGEELSEKVRSCSPFSLMNDEGEKRFQPRCRHPVIELVEKWVYLESPPTGRKIHWATHLANIQKHGARYTSRKNITYTWMQDMEDVVLHYVVQLWNEAFHKKLPKLALEVADDLVNIWDISARKITAQLPILMPDEVPYLTGQLAAIVEIRGTTIQTIQNAMFQISADATTASSIVGRVLRNGWRGAFDKARSIRGKGSFATRQALLEAKARSSITKMVQQAIKKVEERLSERFDSFQDFLDEFVWVDAMEKIDNQVNAIFERSRGHETDCSQGMTAEDLRFLTLTLAQGWRSDWEYPNTLMHMSDGSQDKDAGIPAAYPPPPDNDSSDESSAEEDHAAMLPLPKRRERGERGGEAQGGRRLKKQRKARAADEKGREHRPKKRRKAGAEM